MIHNWVVAVAAAVAAASVAYLHFEEIENWYWD